MVYKPEIMFLIGAGASYSMGIPTMKEFTNAFEGYEKDYQKSSIIHEIKEKIEEEKWDLESLLLSIKSILSIEEDISFDLLDLKYSQQYGQFSKFKRSAHENLLADLLNFIKQKCIEFEKNKAEEVYKPLLDLSKIAKLHLFTTNYDYVIEEVCASDNSEFEDGFIPDSRGSFIWDEKRLGASDTINLYKLHGSISWYRDRSRNEIFKEPRLLTSAGNITDMMIYPGETKEALEPPYFELFSEFVRLLYTIQKCVVIGSSLRDKYLRDFLSVRSMQEDFKLYLVSPLSSQIKEEIFKNSQNIISYEMKFEEWVESGLNDFKEHIEEEHRNKEKLIREEERKKVTDISNAKIAEEVFPNIFEYDKIAIAKKDFYIVRGQYLRVLNKISSLNDLEEAKANKNFFSFIRACIERRDRRDERIKLSEDLFLYVIDQKFRDAILSCDYFLPQILESQEFIEACNSKNYEYLKSLMESQSHPEAKAHPVVRPESAVKIPSKLEKQVPYFDRPRNEVLDNVPEYARQVLHFVDGKRTIGEIVQQSNLSVRVVLDVILSYRRSSVIHYRK